MVQPIGDDQVMTLWPRRRFYTMATLTAVLCAGAAWRAEARPTAPAPVDPSADWTLTVPLDGDRCALFNAGRSGVSDRCQGPMTTAGPYEIIVHDYNARINFEVIRPGENRTPTLRLSPFLTDNIRYFSRREIRWRVIGPTPPDPAAPAAADTPVDAAVAVWAVFDVEAAPVRGGYGGVGSERGVVIKIPASPQQPCVVAVVEGGLLLLSRARGVAKAIVADPGSTPCLPPPKASDGASK